MTVYSQSKTRILLKTADGQMKDYTKRLYLLINLKYLNMPSPYQVKREYAIVQSLELMLEEVEA